MSERDQQPGPSGVPPAEPGLGVEGVRPGHLGYVAHEIRNPLSTALWTAELLTRLAPEERGGARGEKLSALCLRAINRVRLLVEDHLLCERLDAGGYPVRPEPVALERALDVALARGAAGEAAVERLVAPGLAVLADEQLLVRALDGLVAVAAAGVPTVRVEGRAEAGRVVIRVAGAPPGSLADPTKGAQSEQRGRSLALPVARRVAAAAGGELRVEGDAYRLELPGAPLEPRNPPA